MEALLTVFGIDWKMLLAEGLNFIVLLVGLSYFLYKPVMKMIESRKQVIEKGVQDAKEAEEALAHVEAERSAKLSAAEKQAEELLARAVAEGKQERGQIVKAAQERSDAVLAEARAQGAELSRRALAESEKEIARTAVLAAEKLLAQK